MPNACRPSVLTIPNEEGHVAAAADYVGRLAVEMGFNKTQAGAVADGLRRGLIDLLRYSFEPQEQATLEIVTERVPGGMQVRVRDRGRPFGAAGPAAGSEAPTGFLRGLAAAFDEIRFTGRGAAGKELLLVKTLPDPAVAEFAAACPLDVDAGEAPAAEDGGNEAAACRVRRLDPAEAHAIPQVVYRAYGYSYPHDYLYQPEKIAALNLSGEVISAVAVAASGRIVGHCSLKRWEENPAIAEIAQGVVAPRFRSRGCFSNLTAFLIQAARAEGLSALFGETVTVHPYSQQTALQHGFRDCGVLLGMVPAVTEFKGIGPRPAGRGSMVLQHLWLRDPPAAVVYPPPAHRAMIAAVYAHLGLTAGARRELGAPAGGAQRDRPDEATRMTVRLSPPMSFARIRIERFGPEAADAVRRRLKGLCREKWEVIHLVLALSDPETARWCARFEELGFFFAGLLPLGLNGEDALILQYLNNIGIAYDDIRTASPFAAELLAYIRARDPNGDS